MTSVKDMQWEGMLAPLHTISSDGRMIGDPSPEALAQRPLPVPLLYQDALAPGHDGGVPVGLITHAWIEGTDLMGRGTFNADERGQDMAARVARGEHGWVSVTVGNADMSVHCGNDPDSKPYERADGWELLSATLVSEPAFGTARIKIAQPTHEESTTPLERREASIEHAAGGATVLGASTSLPVADDGHGWDGGAAKKRIEAWADGDTSKLGEAFLLRDGDPENIGSYKLPYADVIDGRLTIVPRAVMAIGSVLSGGRGGVDSGGNQAALKSAAARLYKKIGKDAPWSGKSENSTDPTREPTDEVDGVDDEIAADHDDANPDHVRGGRAHACDCPEDGHVEHCADSPTGSSEQVEDTGARRATAAAEHALLAAGGPLAPPAVWFEDPHLAGPTALTVTDDGRVFGHLAAFATCHVGFPGRCVQPPRSKTGYAGFHQGHVVSREGTAIRVGKIITGTSHASLRQSAQDAFAHYAHTGMAVAYVHAGEDEHGIWVAGSLVPELSERHVAELRASPLSGDWRDIGGSAELVAALAVNVPGFPIPAARTNAFAETHALVAAGAVQREDNAVEVFADQVADAVVVKMEAAKKKDAKVKAMGEAMNRVRKQRVDVAIERARTHAVHPDTAPIPKSGGGRIAEIVGRAKRVRNQAGR